MGGIVTQDLQLGILTQGLHFLREDGYRKRWQHDKIVRSTHGANCTGSLLVKDLRQGRHRHMGDAADRLSAHAAGTGTVFEWVEDCYHKDYNGAPTEHGAALGSKAVLMHR